MHQETYFPWFIISLSTIHMAVFTYEVNLLWSECGVAVGLFGPGISDSCSLFVYNPSKRTEVWRHITHSFAHDGWAHLASCLFYNLLFGIPVERVYGHLRTCASYFSGVLATSLICSVLKPSVGSIGGSAGSMALIGVILTMNRHKMTKIKIFAALIIACEPLGFIYLNYDYNSAFRPKQMEHIIAKAEESDILGHMVGFITGILFGIRALRSIESQSWRGRLLNMCTVSWSAMIIAAILINAFALEWFPPEGSDRKCTSICRNLPWEAHVGKPITYWDGLQEKIMNEISPKRILGTHEYWSNSLDEQTINELRELLKE